MRYLKWLLATALLAAMGLSVRAEMVITLKNGQSITLPYDAGDIGDIRFSDGTRMLPSGKRKPGVAPAAKSATAAPASRGGRRLIRVGPGRAVKRPGAAAKIAKDNDIIEIDGGLYSGDTAIWRANNLVIRGVGGRVRLDAAGNIAEGKAIWVVKGANTTIENIEFFGARVRDKNGAGIRQEGAGLTVRNSVFRNNEMGILAGTNPASDIVIENSEFASNTVDYRRYGRLGHNVYIGRVRSFTLRQSYVHGAVIGHNVKSRAARNFILYNRIIDGDDGGSSYLLDLSNGGRSYVIGNVFQQSPRNDNKRLIAFAPEGDAYDDSALFLINNTMVNDDSSGTMVRNHSAAPALLINNIFVGPGTILEGPGVARQNLLVRRGGNRNIERMLYGPGGRGLRGESPGNRVVTNIGFADRARYDFRLRPGSPAIDMGVDPGKDGDVALEPVREFVPPVGGKARPRVGPIDIGAYEYDGR